MDKANPLKTMPQKETGRLEVSVLANSVLFFIESVMIIVEKNQFRLLAIHQNQVLLDRSYETVKGARIAFFKFFRYRAWAENISAEWTSFYPPDPRWLETKKGDIPY